MAKTRRAFMKTAAGAAAFGFAMLRDDGLERVRAAVAVGTRRIRFVGRSTVGLPRPPRAGTAGAFLSARAPARIRNHAAARCDFASSRHPYPLGLDRTKKPPRQARNLPGWGEKLSLRVASSNPPRR